MTFCSTFLLMTIADITTMMGWGGGYSRNGPSQFTHIRCPKNLFYHRLGLEHGFTVEYDAGYAYIIL